MCSRHCYHLHIFPTGSTRSIWYKGTKRLWWQRGMGNFNSRVGYHFTDNLYYLRVCVETLVILVNPAQLWVVVYILWVCVTVVHCTIPVLCSSWSVRDYFVREIKELTVLKVMLETKENQDILDLLARQDWKELRCVCVWHIIWCMQVCQFKFSHRVSVDHLDHLERREREEIKYDCCIPVYFHCDYSIKLPY